MRERTAQKRAAIMELLDEGCSAPEVISILRRPDLKVNKNDVWAAMRGVCRNEYELESARKRGFNTLNELADFWARRAGFADVAAQVKARIEEKGETLHEYHTRLARRKGFDTFQQYRNDLARKKGLSGEVERRELALAPRGYSTRRQFAIRLDRIPIVLLVDKILAGKNDLATLAKEFSELTAIPLTQKDIRNKMSRHAGEDNPWFSISEDGKVTIDKGHWFVKGLILDAEGEPKAGKRP